MTKVGINGFGRIGRFVPPKQEMTLKSLELTTSVR